MNHHAALLAGSWLCVALAAGAPVTRAARSPASQQSQTPVFRTGVDLVQLDVSVLDRQRRPIRGLAAAEFRVYEDGVLQPVGAFAAIDFPDVVAPATPWMREVAADVTTNEIENRRVFVLVLDDAVAASDPWATRAVIDSATAIIEQLGPTDLASVIFTRDNRQSQDLTTDRARLLKAVNTFSRLGSVNMGCTYPVMSLSVLERLPTYLAAIPERRKAVVYLSPGVGIPSPMARDDCNLNSRFRDAITNAQRANVNFYPIDVCGLAPVSLAPQGLSCRHAPAMLQELADNTGGRAVVRTNDFAPGIQQMFRENSSYYLLGYSPTNARADGTIRRIEVQVDRPDVDVWTRKQYVAPKPPPPPGAKATPPPAAVQALAEIVPKPDLPLRVAVAPFAVPGRPAAVTIALGLRQPWQGDRFTDEVKLLVKAYTPEGAERASASDTIVIAVPPARRGSEFTRYDALARLDLKPGRYALRLSAHSGAADKDGSVYVDVDVPDFEKAPLSLSGVALAVAPGVPVAPAGALGDLVPVIPTTERSFARAERVSAFLRVHQGGKSAIAPVALAIRILDGTGAAVFEETATLAPDRFSAGGRAADVTFAPPLVRLAPGDYLLTFEATLGRTAGRRDVRFVVR